MYSVRSLSKTERKQEMIKKYSEEKRLEVIEVRKDGATIAQIAAQTGVEDEFRFYAQKSYLPLFANFVE